MRVSQLGEGGIPEVRYGWVDSAEGLHAVVLFDGDLGSEVVHLGTVQPVEVTTVQLVLRRSGPARRPRAAPRAGEDVAGGSRPRRSRMSTRFQDYGDGNPTGAGQVRTRRGDRGGSAYLLVAGLSPPITPTVYVRAGAAASAEAFDDHRQALAAADAHRLEPVAAVGGLQTVDEGGHDPGAGLAERVAEGDGAAVHVELIGM